MKRKLNPSLWFWGASLIAVVIVFESTAAADSTDVLTRVKPSVFTIKVQEEQNKVFKTGTGFVISDDGFAITNFHVIQGASAATASFEDVKGEFRVELFSVMPDFDLALVKLPASVDGLPRRYKALKLAAGDPTEGTEVWAIGYPELGYSVTRGIVNGNREFRKLPASLQKEMRYNPSSQWIQTDCTINPGNSGGPLVNSAGEVLGINTWRWRGADNAYFALNVVHAKELLGQRPTQPLTFAEGVKRYGKVVVPRSSFPRLEIVKSGNASDLAKAAVTLLQTGSCSLCKGEGSVERVVTRTTGGLIKREENSTVEKECTRCKGSGLNQGMVIYRLMTKIATASATLRTTDPSAAKAKDQARLLIKTFAGIGVENITKGLQQESKATLGRRDIASGTPIVIAGSVTDELRLPGDGDRFRVLREAGSGQLFVLAETDLVSATARDHVFAGGLWAGHLDLPNGQVVGVLQGGFVVDVSDAVGQENEKAEPGKPDWRAVYDVSVIETTVRVESYGQIQDVKMTVQDRVLFSCSLRNMSKDRYSYSGQVVIFKNLSVPVANPPVLGKAVFQTPSLKPGEVYSFEVEVPVESIKSLGRAMLVNVTGR